jgi:hypothetical protein
MQPIGVEPVRWQDQKRGPRVRKIAAQPYD